MVVLPGGGRAGEGEPFGPEPRILDLLLTMRSDRQLVANRWRRLKSLLR